MSHPDHRRHPRLKHRAKIRVILPVSFQEYILDMRDFSESGLFLLGAEDVPIDAGMVLEVQTTEFDDAPIQTVKVVRVEQGVGFAVEFTAD